MSSLMSKEHQRREVGVFMQAGTTYSLYFEQYIFFSHEIIKTVTCVQLSTQYTSTSMYVHVCPSVRIGRVWGALDMIPICVSPWGFRV